MFEQSGFLHQEAHRSAYKIGPMLVQIASSIVDRAGIEAAARPFLMDLVAEINETAHVCILNGAHVVFLDCVESTQRVRVRSFVDDEIAAHATAAGKALLADLPDETLNRLLPARLESLTRKTISTRTELIDQLRHVRERGYALSSGELEPHVAECASVIRDASGITRGSIVIACPTSRFARYDISGVYAAIQTACLGAAAAFRSAPGA